MRRFGDRLDTVKHSMKRIAYTLFCCLSLACNSDSSGQCDNCDAAFDLTGVWHLDIAFDPASRFAAALRLERNGGSYRGHLFGETAKQVVVDKDHLLVELSPADSDDPLSRRILRLDQLDENGAVNGTYENCNGEECFTAEVVGHKVEPLDETVAANVTLIAEYGQWTESGITVNVRVHKNMAYLARYDDGLRIVDLTRPDRPTQRGHYPVDRRGEIYNDVKVVERADGTVYALMASSLAGVVVLDVSDPDAPRNVTSFPPKSAAPESFPSVHTLFVEGDRAYLAYNFDNSLRIYNIANPAAPTPLGSFLATDRIASRATAPLGMNSAPHPLSRRPAAGGYLHDLYVEDGRAYLNYWNLGMIIVDTRDDPANPTEVGRYRDYGQNTSHSNWVTRVSGRTLSVHGDEQYGAHVRIVDVAPESPEFLSTVAGYQTRPEVSVHNIMAHGDRAFVTYYQDGLRILDISDPANPTLAGHYHTWPGFGPRHGHSFFEGAIGVDFDPESNTIYVADTQRGLLVLSLD